VTDGYRRYGKRSELIQKLHTALAKMICRPWWLHCIVSNPPLSEMGETPMSIELKR
jgi:hypothetical protein